MDVKGTAVKTIPVFVRKRYPEQYDEWYQSLPQASKKIVEEGIITSNWYPAKDAAVGLTDAIANVFYNGDVKTAGYECGKFSADEALSGIYKLYVKASSPNHIIERANRAFTAYYNPSEMKVVSKTNKSVTVQVTQQESFPTIEYRIAGWMHRALEISGCKNVNVDITKSISRGDAYSEFVMRWD